jgi:hypothetical protein
MLRITAGVSLNHAAWLVFSTLSITLATSCTRTGAPFLYPMMMGFYSALLKI